MTRTINHRGIRRSERVTCDYAQRSMSTAAPPKRPLWFAGAYHSRAFSTFRPRHCRLSQ